MLMIMSKQGYEQANSKFQAFFLDEFSVEFWVEGSIFNFCVQQDVLALILLVEPLLKTVLWDPEEPLSSNFL